MPGDWIPAVINFSSSKGSKGERDQIVRLYRELGLKIQTPAEGEEAGIYHFWQLLSSNKLNGAVSRGRCCLPLHAPGIFRFEAKAEGAATG